MAKKWLNSIENKKEEAVFVTDRQMVIQTDRQTESTTKK